MAALDDGNNRESVKDLKVHNVELLVPEGEDHSFTRQSDSSSSTSSDSSSESDKDNIESKHTTRNDQFPPASSTYSTDFGFPSSVWSFQGGTSVTESPPSQQMARPPPGYDPNRIPLSIFSPKPATPNPTSWIHPSQESLFSLQMGNDSHSRDHFLAFNNCQDIDQKHSDSALATDHTSEQTAEFVVAPAPATVQCESMDHNRLVVESEKVVLCDEAQEDSSKEAKNMSSLSYLSGESLASDQSFRFPVLGVESERRGSLTKESEKREVEKLIRPPSLKTETATNPANPSPVNRWYHFSCC